MAVEASASVLVVDDTPSMLRLHTAMLQHAGYVVHSRASALEAIGFLQQQVPDVILLDYMMPVMDAPMFLRAIRKDGRLREVGVILLTASNDEAHIEEAFEAGGNDYLTKPVDRRILVARVKAMVEAQRTRSKLDDASVISRRHDQLLRGVDEARRLQASQLPSCPVRWPGWAMDGALLPCDMVGGDLFDVIPEANGERTVALIDVSGHGLAASMVASTIRSSLRLLVPGRPLPEALAELNHHLLREGEHYACVGLARVHHDRVSISNAGLPPIAVISGNDRMFLSGHGAPPGLIDGTEYDVVEVPRTSGGRVVLVSDGVTEPFGAAEDTEAACERLGLVGRNDVGKNDLFARLKSMFAPLDAQPDDATVLVLEDELSR